jgi:hypothetical protein
MERLRAFHCDKLGQFDEPGAALQGGGDCHALTLDRSRSKSDIAVDWKYMT